MPRPRRKPRVVERHLLAGSRQHLLRSLRAGVCRGVDDPRPCELRRRKLELAMLFLDRADAPSRQLDVRTIEVPDHDLGLAKPQPPPDLLAHR